MDPGSLGAQQSDHGRRQGERAQGGGALTAIAGDRPAVHLDHGAAHMQAAVVGVDVVGGDAEEFGPAQSGCQQ